MGKSPLFAALQHRDFRFLLASNTGAQLGIWSMNLATGFLVFYLTGSPFQLGLISAVNGLATLVSSPIGGALADRFDRRKVVAMSQSVMASCAATLGLLVAGDLIHLWHVYILVFIINCMFACFTPSRQAMVSDLIPAAGLTNAIGINAVVMNAMQALAPAIGGVLLAGMGVQGVYYLMAGGFAWSVTMILSVRKIQVQPNPARPRFFDSVRAGQAYARREPTIAAVLLMIALFATLGNSYQQLMSAYTKTELGLGGGGLGMMLAITGVGAVLGAAAVTAAGDAFPKGQALLLAVAADGVFLIGLGAFAHVASAIPILVGVGMSSACVIALGNVILQRISSDQYRGRVMSLYFLMFGMQPLGSLPAGAVAEAIGLRPTFAISGALIIVATAWMAARSPHLRRL